jgi:hypothetical protein
MTTVYVSKDATVADLYPDTNYGSTDYLETENYATYAAGFFLEFALTRKPIKTATLYLYCATDWSSNNIRHRGITEQFNESTVTWNNTPAISSEFQVDVATTEGAWNSFAYTNILNRTVAHEFGGSVFSQPTYNPSGQPVNFHSREYSSGSYKPYVDLTYYAIDEMAGKTGSALQVGETWNWWGDLHVDSIDCISSPRKVQADITTPWGTTYNNEILTDEGIYSWKNPSASEYFMIIPTIFCGGTNYVQFTQYWWFGKPHFYTKVGGNDANDGISWSDAFATVNKGMTSIPDNAVLHVGFGSYLSEPANNTLSPDAEDVTVVYETATTGGGTGTTTVEVN